MRKMYITYMMDMMNPKQAEEAGWDWDEYRKEVYRLYEEEGHELWKNRAGFQGFAGVERRVRYSKWIISSGTCLEITQGVSENVGMLVRLIDGEYKTFARAPRPTEFTEDKIKCIADAYIRALETANQDKTSLRRAVFYDTDIPGFKIFNETYVRSLPNGRFEVIIEAEVHKLEKEKER